MHQQLAQIPGFSRGYDQRDRIIKLGAALRELRKKHLDISQRQAAEMIGMQQSELSRIETGVSELGPSMTTIGRILDAYIACYGDLNESGVMAFSLQVEVSDPDSRKQTVELIGSGG